VAQHGGFIVRLMHVIGTAGHVDHGKSTLVERLTGIDPDRFEEEKRRGLTIDLGFAWLELPSGLEVGLIDVPGHERFIKNMLAGAGGISVCLFVVAANEGWMPQSAEHLGILDVLEVSHGVVAVTKSDTVDAETIDLAIAEVQEHITGTSLQGAPIVPCSAVTGAGLDELLAAVDATVAAAPPAPDDNTARLWVDRVFTISGAGTVVTGTLTGGSLRVGQEVEIAPARRRARIRAIQTHKREVPHIGPGNRVALNLVGLTRQGATRGDAIVEPERWRATDTLDARVRVLPASIIGAEHVLTEKGAHLVHVGSAETPAKIKLLATSRLGPGQWGYAQLYLRDPLPLKRGDRFVVRDAGRVVTLGGGIVLDPLASNARRSDRARVGLLETLDGAGDHAALRALVDAQGSMPAREALLRSGAATVPEDVARAGGLLLSKDRFEWLGEVVRAALSAHHRTRPLEQGMPREELRADVELPADAFDELLSRLSDIVTEGTTVRLSSHSVVLAPEQVQARDALVHALDAAAFMPPPASELGADPDLLRSLTRSGELVRVGDFYLTAERAAEARRKVRAHIEATGPATVAGIRDLLGTSRRYAVPLCEWLDATGATRRQGDLRSLGPHP
jgi:selenocysteine-specific elongation factor